MGSIPPTDKPAEVGVNVPRAYNPGDAVKLVPPGLGELNYIQMLLDGILNQQLYTTSSPTFVGLTITGLTASQLVATDANKLLTSASVGTSLSLSGGVLNAIQGIRTVDSPAFAGLTIGTLAGILKAAAGVVGAATIGTSLSYSAPTLDAIQDIRTSASPAFAGLTLSGISGNGIIQSLSGALSHCILGDGLTWSPGAASKGSDFSPHNMTTNALPTPYVAAASTASSGLGAFRVFDGGTGSSNIWTTSGAGTGWVSLDIGSGNTKSLYSYKVVSTNANNTRMPKNWTLEGSNNGSSWDVLDTQTDQIAWGNFEEREFTLPAGSMVTPYRYFRLNVSANGSGSYLQVAEIYLYKAVSSYTLNVGLVDTNATHYLRMACGSDLTADRILTFTTGDAARTITLSGNPTLNDWFDQAVKAASSPTFVGPSISYLDMIEPTTPANPGANILRLYVEDFHGFPIYNFRDSTGMVRKIVRDSMFVARATVNITAMQAVCASGATGNTPDISPAKADSLTTMPAIGLALENITAGEFGRVMQVGLIENVNTNAFSIGNVLYVDATTAGALTATAPLYPNIRQEVGTVLVKDVGNGQLQVIGRSMFNEGIIDHRGLLGLDHDDHTQYAPKASPTFTGVVTTPTVKLTTSPTVGQIWTCSNVDGSGGWAAAGSSMVYPGAGMPVSTGAAWGTSVANDTSNVRKFLRELSVAGVFQTPAWDTVLASDVVNTPAGAIVATNVQAAIDELDTEKQARSGWGTYQLLATAGVTGAPVGLTVAEQTLVGRITGGNIAALTAAQVLTLLDIGQAWTTPAFNAGDFTANGSMTWTVEAGDVVTYAYTMLGPHLMLLSFNIQLTTIGGTVNNNLRIKVPNGKTLTNQALIVILIRDNGIQQNGWCLGVAGGTYVSIARTDAANWTAVTNTANVYGQIFLEVD